MGIGLLKEDMHNIVPFGLSEGGKRVPAATTNELLHFCAKGASHELFYYTNEVPRPSQRRERR